MRTGHLLVPLTAMLVGLVACTYHASAIAPTALPTGDSTRTLNYDGKTRRYLLHVPAGKARTRPIPVVLVFHGGGSNADSIRQLTGFSALADQERFLAVYPDGAGRLPRVLTWNGGTCCGYAMERHVDDVGFVRAIIGDLRNLLPIDAKRIYATGLSNGAILSYRLACEASDLMAAIAPVAGTQNLARCSPQEPVSVLHIHGTADQHLPYAGGIGSKSLTGVRYLSVDESIRFWVERNRCHPAPKTQERGEVRYEAYAGCAAGSAVDLYTVVGGGHAWPGSKGPAWRGGDEPSSAMDATRMIWEFFAAHSKP